MINTFTPVLSYLFRCNTDVTSLKSGTALKSVILYVTNYITKSPLKTYTIFEVIKSIFEKNTQLLSGEEKQKEQARKLMTKIVNTMSAKMELGSPMVCMYLLGNPDHYTNFQFRTFYWSSFVNKQNNQIIGVSTVQDYICRPTELDDMTLYDFISLCSKEKLRREFRRIRNREYSDDIDREMWRTLLPGLYKFTSDHPLHTSHAIRLAQISDTLIPNFVGMPIPRSDQGDREQYCLTMLSLFRSWRTGLELKHPLETWDDAFERYTFKKNHLNIMKYLNIRYECQDAADDYYA
ncbi:hypothetical protein BDN72DRAFT_782045, partial [Pluteus cervinus]